MNGIALASPMDAERIVLAASLLIGGTAKRLRACESVTEMGAIADDLDAWLGDLSETLEKAAVREFRD